MLSIYELCSFFDNPKKCFKSKAENLGFLEALKSLRREDFCWERFILYITQD